MWRRLHNEELNDMYSSPNIIWVIKLRRMRWPGQVAHMEEKKMNTAFWWGNVWETDHLEDQGVEKRIILRWIFRNWDEGH